MVTEIEISRLIAIQNNATNLLYKIVNDSNQRDEKILLTIARILKELCKYAFEPIIHEKLITDNIIKTLLILSKSEIMDLRFDISCCIFDLTKSNNNATLKMIKGDGIEILYYLTLQNDFNLSCNEALKLNTAIALRNMTAKSNIQCEIISTSDFIIPIMKQIILSKNEEILTHIAASVHNLMSWEDSKTVMLTRNVLGIVFDLAESGKYLESVRASLCFFHARHILSLRPFTHVRMYVDSKRAHTNMYMYIQTAPKYIY